MPASDLRAVEAWLARDGAELVTVWQATVEQLDLLFETSLGACRWPGASYPLLVDEAGARLDAITDGRRDLFALLSPRRDAVGAGLIAALTEILWLPRRARTEYLTAPRPWDMRRLLLEYAVWSRRIDELLGQLTKGFCATACDRVPQQFGCCTIQGYDMGVVPAMMLRAQALEARWRGWKPPGLQPQCEYHGPAGCCLVLFKSPACAGMLCEGLLDDLRRRLPEAPLDALLRPLALYRNQPLDRSRIFELMRETVEAGQRLLDT